MPESGLPFASALSNNSTKVFGDLSVKNQVPHRSFEEIKKGLKDLEKAAKEQVFAVNEPSE